MDWIFIFFCSGPFLISWKPNVFSWIFTKSWWAFSELLSSLVCQGLVNQLELVFEHGLSSQTNVICHYYWQKQTQMIKKLPTTQKTQWLDLSGDNLLLMILFKHQIWGMEKKFNVIAQECPNVKIFLLTGLARKIKSRLATIF